MSVTVPYECSYNLNVDYDRGYNSVVMTVTVVTFIEVDMTLQVTVTGTMAVKMTLFMTITILVTAHVLYDL